MTSPISKYLYYDHDGITIYCGDCLPVMQDFPDNSIDSIVTDPPYGLRFMGKRWDYDVPSVDIWREVLRVLKPGGHLLSFGGTRTYHRVVVNIEDAGFEIRDQIDWVYGSGFPKSLDVGKAIDKHYGEFIPGEELSSSRYSGESVTGIATTFRVKRGSNPQTKEARQWDGWGTALKPAHEPICLARKPLDGTVAENVLKWGTGGINVDGCRVTTDEDQRRPSRGGENGLLGTSTFKIRERKVEDQQQKPGRFPANFIHDGSDGVVGLFPVTTSGNLNAGHKRGSGRTSYDGGGGIVERDYGGDSGSAARFFYCAKASRSERGEGNGHPTVKPLKLMEYLVTLITPPNGIVLDPFMGSGTTGRACRNKGFKFVGIDHTEDHCEIAQRRIDGICAIAKRRLAQGVLDFEK
jgi:site-specific DNA-methyltransferase (adenine-specific)